MTWALQLDGINDYLSIVETSIPEGEDGSIRLIFRLSSASNYRNVFGNISDNNSVFRIANTVNNAYLKTESATSHTLTYITPLVVGDWYDYTLTKSSGVWDLVDSQTLISVVTSPSAVDNSELKVQQLFRRAAKEYFHGDIQLLDISASITTANNRVWNATDSSHATGTVVLVDTVGANNATGVNMPTDGSAWVDLGGGGLTLTADINIDTPVFSVSSSVTVPATTSNISFDLAKPVFNVSTTVTSPSYSSDASIEMQSPVFNSSATVTLPQPLSGIDLTINAPLFSASVDVTLPSSISNIDLNITKPVFNSSATVTLPQPDLTASISISKPEFSASVTVTDQALNSNINLSINSPVFSVGSSVTLPQPISDIQFNIPNPVFSVSSTVSGLDIVVGSNAKITVSYTSNKLVLQAKSNTIKV